MLPKNIPQNWLISNLNYLAQIAAEGDHDEES
jgi:hypothetical protein